MRLGGGKAAGADGFGTGAWGWLDGLCEEITRRGVEHASDFVAPARGFRFALGCIQALQ